jgi:oligosaccharide repeat unit polymerase
MGVAARRKMAQGVVLSPASVFIPLAVLAYAVALHWVYTAIIQPTFGYTGLRYVEPDFLAVAACWVIATLTALALPRRITRPSSLVLWVLYVATVGPTVLMGAYLDILGQWESVGVGAGIGATFALACIAVQRQRISKPLLPVVSTTSFWLILGCFSALVYIYVAMTAGISLRFVALLDVYDVRDDYNEARAGGALLGYLVSTQANVVNPLLIARGIYSRRWGLVAVGVLGQLVLYSVTGFKTIFFSVAALLIVAIVFRINLRPKGLTFLVGASGLIIAAATVDELQNGVIWSSLLARRFLITPAWLSSHYVDFYSSQPFEMLSHSVLRWFFVSPPHEYPPAQTIGVWLSGSPEMSANANLFADAFAHFGWWGVIGCGVLLAILLRLLDRAAYGIPVAASSLVVLMPAVTLSNTSLLTALLSHGLVVMIVLLAVAPRRGWGRAPSQRAGKQYERAAAPRIATRV